MYCDNMFKEFKKRTIEEIALLSILDFHRFAVKFRSKKKFECTKLDNMFNNI